VAISSVGSTSRTTLGAEGGQALFARLPDRLFGPLASPNRHQYWRFLCSLHERRFGPDAPFPPSQGFHWRDITRDIEDELFAQDAWVGDEHTIPNTPIGIRANEVFHTLREAG
jgi:hypothetical protein